MQLKPQDVFVALKIQTLGSIFWSQRDLASALVMSLSEINGAIRRGLRSGLLVQISNDQKRIHAVPNALLEFICHGISYSFPAERGRRVRGIPTGIAGGDIAKPFGRLEPEDIRVWPFSEGSIHGVGIVPLFKSIPQAMVNPGNKRLHILLSLVDVIREGRSREKEIAVQKISSLLLNDRSGE
jgi:hypothetical protein